MKFLQEGGFLKEIPFTAMRPGEELDEGFFFLAFPDLGDDGIAAERFEGLHPEIAIEQDTVRLLFQNDHGDDLSEALDGGGKCSNTPGPLNPRMGIAKLKPGKLDLFDCSKLATLHVHLTPDGEIDRLPDPCIHKNGIFPLQPLSWYER